MTQDRFSEKSAPDFSVDFHGTITLLRPLNAACREWVDENVATEGWQWFGSGAAGGALAVEPRYLPTLIQGLADAGFTGRE